MASDASAEERILGGLDPEQRVVATTLQGPVCVRAGAGTGKTRAITHRIAWGIASGVYTPQKTLALTFTARAANEMRQRLRQLGAPGVQARTFHSAALRQLQYFWPQAVGGPPPGLVNHKARLLTEAAQSMRLTTDRATVRDVAGEIEWAKVSMLTPDTYAAAAEKRSMPMGYDVRTMQRLYQSYEDLKADRHLIDFEDVLLITVGILEEDERIAAAVHAQYRQFVVDEYQDVSPLQQRLLDAWLGQRDDVCVVGDASQTIYSFTGATSRHLLEFPSRHPNARVVELIRDYRSTPQVVNTANQLLAARRPAAGSTPGTWATPLQLISQRPAGPEPSWNEYPDDEAEAAGVATRIQDLIDDGVPAREIAVLFRTNGQSQAFEAALADANIGFQLRGTERFFNRPEIRQALVQIRSAAKTLGDEPVRVPQQVRDMLSSLGYSARAPRSDSATRARWESLSALVSLADSMAHRAAEEDEEFTLQEFSDELERRAKAQEAPVMDGVTLASMHSAKGLEWDAVFLAGLSEGLMPISFADTADGVDEERRLLYVGITRAREHLVLSWSLSRTPGGRPTRSRSRFLDAILPAAASNVAQRHVRTRR
ncbi:ATP-dependent DNA helicase [Kocuria sp. WRN011]|uniref:DNA 3'-5' helicase n=1 Tax=Kocuria carniphila TaxID=262208 RepID=A0ABV3UZI2_9MICC|nr:MULTISPECIES: ATP-dependent helicase [Kocuria]MCT1802972.1 ATP-dependent helicase [Kocuria carniphila]PBB08693.1 ATP-dependent DNA helicase [Kocuria sp. WRN011]